MSCEGCVRSDAENRFEACIVCTFVGSDGGDSGKDNNDANADAWEREIIQPSPITLRHV